MKGTYERNDRIPSSHQGHEYSRTSGVTHGGSFHERHRIWYAIMGTYTIDNGFATADC